MSGEPDRSMAGEQLDRAALAALSSGATEQELAAAPGIAGDTRLQAKDLFFRVGEILSSR